MRNLTCDPCMVSQVIVILKLSRSSRRNSFIRATLFGLSCEKTWDLADEVGSEIPARIRRIHYVHNNTLNFIAFEVFTFLSKFLYNLIFCNIPFQEQKKLSLLLCYILYLEELFYVRLLNLFTN